MNRHRRRTRHPIPRGLAARPGFALFMALGALVIIAVLVAGSSFITMQETRLGQNTLTETRAFAAAEYGLNKIQADWDLKPNMEMTNGAIDSASYTLSGQGSCKVKYTRLNNETFWLVSEGRATVGNSISASRVAVKRVGAILRLRIPSIRANGAVTTAGNLTIKGSSEVRGANSTPAGWTACDAAPDKAAIVATPTATVSIQKDDAVTGTPQLTRDPLAADSNTYVRFGDETWNALKLQANVVLAGTGTPPVAGNAGDAAPSVLNGVCNKADVNNWGEPWRTAQHAEAKTECYNYFPIIYIAGSAHINKGRGQGIMLVEGDLQINGQFEWYGLIIVRDDIIKGNGSAQINGAIMAANANIGDDSEITGNITFNYSNCSIQRSMRGSAQVVQAKERAWTELY